MSTNRRSYDREFREGAVRIVLESGRPSQRPVAAPQCDRLWTVGEVSEFLGIPVATLHQWRYLGTGPSAFRVGKHLPYDPDTVRTWLSEQCTSSRSA